MSAPAPRASGIGAQREFPKLAQPSHVAPKAPAMPFNSARVATTPAYVASIDFEQYTFHDPLSGLW